jgi:hypothetical protein
MMKRGKRRIIERRRREEIRERGENKPLSSMRTRNADGRSPVGQARQK